MADKAHGTHDDDELADRFTQSLVRLMPKSSSLDRDELIFLAGQQVASRANDRLARRLRAWQLATCLAGVVAGVSASLLLRPISPPSPLSLPMARSVDVPQTHPSPRPTTEDQPSHHLPPGRSTDRPMDRHAASDTRQTSIASLSLVTRKRLTERLATGRLDSLPPSPDSHSAHVAPTYFHVVRSLMQMNSMDERATDERDAKRLSDLEKLLDEKGTL